MNENCIENVALTFIEERIFQTYDKQNQKKITSIGLETEASIRACFRQIFRNKGISISDKKDKKKLTLNLSDFIKAGVKQTKSFPKNIHRNQRQCDICIKIRNIEKIHGEVKTTTSADHNVCILINKNLTALRKYNVIPLSIIFYPAKRDDSLRDRHASIVTGLLKSDIIDKEEYELLIECFFILTKNKTDQQLKADVKKKGAINFAEISFLKHSLFKVGHINFKEWNRLLEFVSKTLN